MSNSVPKKIKSDLKFVYSENSTLSIIFSNNEDLLGVVGEFNNNIKELEKVTKTSIYSRGNSIILKNESQRNSVQKALNENGIPSVVYYVIPGHLQKGYKYLGYKRGDFPVSEDLSERILSLPMHPYLSLNNISFLIFIL